MLNAINTYLSNRSPAQVVVLGLVLVAAVGTVDHLTGYELSFSIFYLLPIVLVTWWTQKWVGLVFCGLSAMIWLFADYASGHTYSKGLIPLWNTGVRLGFFLVTWHLLIQFKTSLRHAQVLAETDGLTGVLNGRAFRNLAHHLFMSAARHHRPVALGFIDIDDFKAVNDTSGHTEGDRVLKTVANTLTRCVRATDVIGRLGGDEFAILLPEATFDEAQVVFGKIRDALMQDCAGFDQQVGVSIGVAVFNSVPSTIDEAMKIADRLMYRVKNAGKNNTIYEEQAKDWYDVQRNEPTRERPWEKL